MKMMFICTGNICRSAMAHMMMEKKLKEHKINDVEVYSCGIHALEGDMPTREGIEVMKDYGIDLSIHRPTHILNSNIKDMDVILCATFSHKINVISMYPELKDKVFTMKEYAGCYGDDIDIRDPYGYGLNVYINCAKEIDECLDKILERM